MGLAAGPETQRGKLVVTNIGLMLSGALEAPLPTAGRPGMLVRAPTSLLICSAELSAPVMGALPSLAAALYVPPT